MKETQRRIKAYKAALPGLKERIAAVAVLLAMSVAMMTSATFAWLTISRAPEITGVNTTVAANGNLEIALVPKDGSQPAESAVGDSSAAQGQSVTGANLTWGNLVNLSDPSYGLDNLTLRPAQLNQAALLTSPLYGAVYREDGRVEKLSSNFAYATWQPPEGKVEGYFLVTDDYGIRAISSTTVKAVGFAENVLAKRDAAEEANLMARESYLDITRNQAWMNSLAVIMGTFMTAKMNAGQNDASLTNPTMQQEDITNLRDIFAAMIDAYEKQMLAEVALINYQLYLLNNSEESNTPYVDFTVEDLMKDSCTEASLKAQGIQVTGLKKMKDDYKKLVENLAKLDPLCEQGSLKWADSGLKEIVDGLMIIGTCTLDGTPINNIGASNASQYLDGEVHYAVITNGVLYNFEALNGAECKVEKLTVSAKVKRMGITVPASIEATITTSAQLPSQFQLDMEYAKGLNKGGQGVAVAQDTYGLAIDLWVRTNAADSYLTLEGNVLTKTDTVRDTAKDANGNTVELFTLNMTDENGDTISQDVYQLENEDGSKTWYYATSHTPVEEDALTDNEPVAKMKEIVTVIGYEGENRIWEDREAAMLSTDSTTQGSGSCYVYYADTPEDQARSLELLGAMHVAFVDEKGKLLGSASMDTEHFYAENGRVTVPLRLDDDSIDLGYDVNGEKVLAITPLEQNVAMRITCIVYLDGTRLGNEDVLAASDIQGKLNIQFGSSVELIHMEDEKLLNAIRSASASLSATKFDYDVSVENGTPMKTTVTVRVEGDQPQNLTAFFLRALSSTQGSREEVMTFTNNGDGTWSADYTFTAPGNYVLRTVELDGTEYDLKEPQYVTVNGFTVTSLTANNLNIMTAESTGSVDLTLQFASSKEEAMPKSVQGRFLRDDGTAVNITFTYNANAGAWKGTGRFITSGEYQLQYLILDGNYMPLPENLWQTANVTLGMKVAVYTDSPVRFVYDPSKMQANEWELYMKVKILDNSGKEMEALNGAHLYYGRTGSSVVELGFDAPLTWNATSGYYECKFPSKVGMYDFRYVTVGGNTLSVATTAPAFTIQSLKPPTFNSGNTTPYQYVPNNNAFLSVMIDECVTENVWAVITNASGKSYEVKGRVSNNSWVFDVPKDANGNQDGVWTIQELRLWGVYDESGNEYTQESPMVFDLTGEEGVTAKVISQVFITIDPVADNTLGKDDAGKVTGKFMDTYTITGLNVKFEDYSKEPIGNTGATGTFNSYISDVWIEYAYGNNSSTYGGYSSDTLTNALGSFNVPLSMASDGILFKQTSDVTVRYAGTYTATLHYTINNVSYSTKVDSLSFAVWSEKMVLTIDAISPEGQHKTVNSSDATTTVTSGINGNTVTIYPNSEVTGSGCNKKGVLHEEPKVTLKLTGLGNGQKATLTFREENNGTVRMYSGSSSKNGTQTNAYVWEKGGSETVMRFIGYNDAGSCDDSEPAGKLISSTTLIVEYKVDEQTIETYNVTVSEITIINKKP